MRWQKKWFVACVLTIGVIGMVQIEERDGGNSQIRSLFEEGKDIQYARKIIMSLMTDEKLEEVIPVSASVHPSMKTYESMQPYQDGVLVSYTSPVQVVAREDGLILFTGQTKQTGKTMTILYDSGETVTYGFIESFTHLPYTAVATNELIAEVQPGSMYVRVERDGQYLEPSTLTEWISNAVK